MSAPTVDSNEIDLAAAKDILARLERYAASVRTTSRDPLAPPAPPVPPAPAAVPKHPMAAATAPPDDLLPVTTPWAFQRQPDVSRVEFPYAPSPSDTERRRINPATADLFPYDLAASIVACALIIMAYISFGRPVAIVATVSIAITGEWMRRARWFPSVGMKLLIGTVVGLILVFTA